MVTPAQIRRRKKRARELAKELGIPVPRRMNSAGVAGRWYRELIRRLQKHYWPKLPTTGIADTRLLAKMFPPKPETKGHHALRIAQSYLGITEHPAGSNRGPVVDTFLAACGFHFKKGQQGVPWCACAVTRWLHLAGWNRRGWNQAYVPAWVAAAHAGQGSLLVIGWKQAEAGDIACFDWGHDGVADHIGFVAGPVKNGQFPTVEGNTAVGNDSNGGEVMARTRSLSDVVCFIRVT